MSSVFCGTVSCTSSRSASFMQPMQAITTKLIMRIDNPFDCIMASFHISFLLANPMPILSLNIKLWCCIHVTVIFCTAMLRHLESGLFTSFISHGLSQPSGTWRLMVFSPFARCIGMLTLIKPMGTATRAKCTPLVVISSVRLRLKLCAWRPSVASLIKCRKV